MSHQAVTWAYDQEVTPYGAKFVLVTLANYANGDGYCYPGQHTLAQDTGMSGRAVRGHLQRLERDGIIFRQHRYDTRGKRTSDGCWLVGFKPLPADVATSLPAESATSETPLPENPAPTTGNERHDYRQNLPVYIRNEPSEEPSEEPSDIALPKPARESNGKPWHDEMFEAIYEACTGNPYVKGQHTSKGYRGKVNAAIGGLQHVDPCEVPIRAAEYRVQYPGIKLTPTALANHWDELTPNGRPTPKRTESKNDTTRNAVNEYIAGNSESSGGGDWLGVDADGDGVDERRPERLGPGMVEIPDGRAWRDRG